jgi:hypothetical protein
MRQHLEGGTSIHGPLARERRTGVPHELLAVWGMFALVSVAIVFTYARLPSHELYHVSGSGLVGGLSRALVFLNYPLALVAIPILAILAERLSSPPALVAAAIVGIGLSAAIFWPGIVTQSDLDARWVNAVPALGVLVAVALTVFGWRGLGRAGWAGRQSGDVLRILLAAVVLVLAVPWLAADLGVSFEGVPGLGTLYQTTELRTQPGVTEPHPAVHHGHHHGLDGVLLVLTALLLSRILPSIARGWVQVAVWGYLALMFCYGATALANDFWLEQVVKRGWTNWEIPDVTTPKASLAWLLIVVAAAALWTVTLVHARRSNAPHALETA